MTPLPKAQEPRYLPPFVRRHAFHNGLVVPPQPVSLEPAADPHHVPMIILDEECNMPPAEVVEELSKPIVHSQPERLNHRQRNKLLKQKLAANRRRK